MVSGGRLLTSLLPVAACIAMGLVHSELWQLPHVIPYRAAGSMVFCMWLLDFSYIVILAVAVVALFDVSGAFTVLVLLLHCRAACRFVCE